MKTISAAIFDLDGTIFDSMTKWINLDVEILQEHGIEPDPEFIDRTRAMSIEDACATMIAEYRLDYSEEQLCREVAARMARFYAEELELKAHAARFVSRLAELGVRLCVATANDRRLSESALDRLQLTPLFEFVLTCPEIGAGKDKPDIFLEAQRRLGLPACEIIVFEDSLMALRTARSLGFITAGVADAWNAHETDAIRDVSDYWIADFTIWPFDDVRLGADR